MKDWLVVLRDRSDIDALRRVVSVDWDAKYSPVVAIKATERQAEAVRGLPGVLSVTEPQMGHAMV